MPYDKHSFLFKSLIDKINEVTGVPKDYVRDVFKAIPLALLQMRVGESYITPIGKFYWKSYKSRYCIIPTEESGYGHSKPKIRLKFKAKRTLTFTDDSPLWPFLNEPPRPRPLGDDWKGRKKRPYTSTLKKTATNIKTKKKPDEEQNILKAGISLEEVNQHRTYEHKPKELQPIPTVDPPTKPQEKINQGTSTRVVVKPPITNPLVTKPVSVFKSLLKAFADTDLDEDDEESDGNEEFDD